MHFLFLNLDCAQLSSEKAPAKDQQYHILGLFLKWPDYPLDSSLSFFLEHLVLLEVKEY